MAKVTCNLYLGERVVRVDGKILGRCVDLPMQVNDDATPQELVRLNKAQVIELVKPPDSDKPGGKKE